MFKRKNQVTKNNPVCISCNSLLLLSLCQAQTQVEQVVVSVPLAAKKMGSPLLASSLPHLSPGWAISPLGRMCRVYSWVSLLTAYPVEGKQPSLEPDLDRKGKFPTRHFSSYARQVFDYDVLQYLAVLAKLRFLSTKNFKWFCNQINMERVMTKLQTRKTKFFGQTGNITGTTMLSGLQTERQAPRTFKSSFIH